MEHLTTLKNLKVINLDDTRVTKRGEKVLKDAIPGLKIDR
jgi:Ran GTPase-activating protein (RanGAP) involved in mRNA processing and transport